MSHLIKPIPLLDNLGTPIFIGLFLLLFWLQSQRPLRRRHFSALQRMVRNFAFSTPGFAAMRLAMVPIPLTVAAWAEEQGIGLFHWLGVSGWAAAILGFVFMDWAYYWWHYLNHTLPFFWRFHNVHHTDLDLDVSTAARFHFGEIILSVPFRVLVVALLGIPFRALLIFEIIFESATMFHHSNWRLPLGLERALNHVIVTPRMHGIHHSIVEKEIKLGHHLLLVGWASSHPPPRH